MKKRLNPGRNAPRRRFLRAGTLFCAPLALLLSGCGGEGVPIVMTSLAGTPTECTSGDPRWKPLPDADVTRSQAARNYQTNKEAFNAMRYRRAICRAGIRAAQAK